MLSISDSALHPHFFLCLSCFRVQKKSYSDKTLNQSLKYHDNIAVGEFVFSWAADTLESFWQWLWLYFNLYVCELCLWVAGIKGFYFRGEHRKRGTYSVVWAGDHGVCHPGAEPWPWCTHCDGITDASQLPAAWRSKKRKIHIYVEKVCIYST